MSAYIAILSAHIRTLLQYRTAALAGTITQLFWGLIRTMLFAALYSSSSTVQPMTESEAINYVWLGQAMFAVSLVSIDNDFRVMVRNGTVAYELLRPIDLYSFWYCRAIANRFGLVLLRTMPVLSIALFLGLKPPVSLAAAAAWILTTLGAFLLTSAISTLGSIAMVLMIEGEGINKILNVFILIFSGMIVPLPFFPDKLQPILNFLPFRDIIDVPFQLYLGHIPPQEVLVLVFHQLAWILAFVALGRLLLASGIRRLVIQGG